MILYSRDFCFSLIELIAFLFLSIVCFFIYGNALHAPFIFDDKNITDVALLHARSLSDFIEIFVQDAPDPFTGEINARRLGYLSFAINHFFNGLNPFSYRLVNVIIHIVNGFLIYWLLTKIFALRLFHSAIPFLSINPGDAQANVRLMAFCVTMLWLVHPIQIQSVTYVVQRLESLSSLFILLGLAFYLAGRQREGRVRLFFYVVCVLAGLLGMGVKQKAAILPVLILTYELYFFNDSPKKAFKEYWRRFALLFIFLMSVTIYYMGIDFWNSIQSTYMLRDFNMEQRLLTQARVVLYYLSLVLFPAPARLNLDYDYTISTSLFNPWVTLPAVITVFSLVAYALLSAEKHRFLSYAILWFFICLVIESTIIPLELVYEHRLYLASLAPISVFVVLVFKSSARFGTYAPIICILPLAILLAAWTVERNATWADEITLWSDVAEKSPRKPRVLINLGNALNEAGRYDEAEQAFKRAIEADPKAVLAYVNLAVLYMNHSKQYDAAEELLRKVQELGFHHSKVYTNLAIIAFARHKPEDGLAALQLALKSDPSDLRAHKLLAWHYASQQRYRRALHILQRGLSYWPKSHELYLEKGKIYLKLNQLAQARHAIGQANILQPGDADVGYYQMLVNQLSDFQNK